MSADTINDIKGVPQTFSSWDSCMKESYCKYPAIIGIIIGVLIAVSVIWCCVRCCCCGMSCCCGCFSCFGRCCPSGRGRKPSKYADPPSDYRPSNPYMGYIPPSNPPAYQGPNTATFNMPGKKINGDSLPAMPTWKDGKLQDSTRGDVEMGNLAQSGQATGVVPVAGGRTSKGGYRELSNHDDFIEQPGSYRGTDSTHPYGSDLGAQSMMAHNTPYDPPRPQPYGDTFMPGAAAPFPYSQSTPPQPTYAAYSPNPGFSSSSSGQARPPSLLQVGRKPLGGSSREV